MSNLLMSKGQRHVSGLDGSHASAPLDPDFLRAFKQIMPISHRPSFFTSSPARANPAVPSRAHEPGTVIQPLGNEPGAANHLRDEEPSTVPDVPATIFADFPSLPSRNVLDSLVQIFSSRFLPNVPFLHTLFEESTFHNETKPYYFTLAMAAVGSILSETSEMKAWGRNLFHAAIFVHSGSSEVDNRMTRRLDWVASVSLPRSG